VVVAHVKECPFSDVRRPGVPLSTELVARRSAGFAERLLGRKLNWLRARSALDRAPIAAEPLLLPTNGAGL